MAKKSSGSRTKRQEYNEIDRSYSRVSRGKYVKKNKGSDKPAAIITVCISVVAIIGILAGSILLINNSQIGTLPAGITVAGVDVGGMTRQEAIDAVTSATKDTYPNATMVVTVLDSQIKIGPEVSKASLNVKDAVRAAFKHDGTGAVDISHCMNLDEKAVRDALAPLGTQYSSTLSQTRWEVTGEAPAQELVITLGFPEYALDLNRLYTEVVSAYCSNRFTMTGTCGKIEPKAIDLQEILSKYYVPPKDASFDPKTGNVTEGENGYGFDLVQAQKALDDAQYGSTVKISFASIPPAVSGETIQSTFFQDTLGSFTATSTSESNRDTNLRLACEAINGMVINPGQVFSYNKALGERTSARGYKPGPSFSGGKTVTTIGGGICQVSSALYNSVLQADLQIEVRENHGYAVEYVRLGMDAAVSWGSLDFCFTNNTGYPIRIEASASGGTTVVSILGTDSKDYYIEMEYEVLATYNYETKYETMTLDNADGYKDGEVIILPHTGYEVQTYRCKYDKNTKALLSREKEDYSRYNKCDKVICKISGNSPAPGIGNGGVTEADVSS